MRNSLRFSVGTLALVTIAACSNSTDKPVLADDLKQDLAKIGAGDVQLASISSPRVDIVSASERLKSPTPSPKAPAKSRAPSAVHGRAAAVASVKHETPAPAPTVTRVEEEVAPVEAPRMDPVPEPAPAAAGRPSAPRPSTQREPAGGWKTPSQVIRNAPFPINP
ncbi:MAG: hypothetical protein V4550_09500 [Gemmatimonadota bacterium]